MSLSSELGHFKAISKAKMVSFKDLVTWYVQMALKLGFYSPFGPKLPVEFEPFDQKIFGQRLMYISYSILRDRSA